MGESVKPILMISQGDPRGIGPEIILKAVSQPALSQQNQLVVVADESVMMRASNLLGRPLDLPKVHEDDLLTGRLRKSVSLLPLPMEGSWDSDEAVGRHMGLCIETCARFCLSSQADGMVTAPIEKSLLNKGGFVFDGHTELLQAQAKAEKVVMMMAGDRLKVALVTIHTPFRQIVEKLTTTALLNTLNITREGLINYFGYAQPRLAVAGLNPHASDHGLFGDEEERIISPAVDVLSHQGIQVEGPLSPDAVFRMAADGRFDCVIALYHDQGLIPFKMLHFTDGVNVTLGLPFVRTSPDHGVAYDIAGTGRADPRAMIAAIRMAGEMTRALQRRQAETVVF